MGAVVETPSIYPSMTAEKNLKIQYNNLGIPDFKDIPELLKLVGLENTDKKKVKDFSFGMRQRLGIAVALAGSPDFLILDEPINGLDPQGIIEMRELILKLNRGKKITVLISSHILDELSRIATHYGFIDGETMVKEISAEELEKLCKKCMRITVSDVYAIIKCLYKSRIEYNIINDNIVVTDTDKQNRITYMIIMNDKITDLSDIISDICDRNRKEDQPVIIEYISERDIESYTCALNRLREES